jgi:hypothetical protein
MNVRILESFGTPLRAYHKTEVANVPKELAISLVAGGMAEYTTDPTPAQIDYHNRVKISAGQDCLFLPAHGLEFGHEIMHRCRLIHAHHARKKIVTCKRGHDVLYPSADQIIHYDDIVPDRERAGAGRDEFREDELEHLAACNGWTTVRTGGFTSEQEYECRYDTNLTLTPRKRGLQADVMLGIRYREFCPEKNWTTDKWNAVAAGLMAAGFTVAVAGKRPYTLDVDHQLFHTGDYPDTDATVEALQNAKLFISTDTGVAHLAALVKTPSLLFRHPGHHRDYIPIMTEINRNTYPINQCWNNPQRIIDVAVKLLNSVGSDSLRTEAGAI